MAGGTPLPTLLSQVLVAHTMELDNEFERRLLESGANARVTSLVMWSNFLRFVDDGITVGELPDASGLPRARVLSNLGGMERWRYVTVGPGEAEGAPIARRVGSGSARGLKRDWLIRPTDAGRFAQETWPGLFGEIEERWRQRFGAGAVRALRQSVEPIVARFDFDLPRYPPIAASSDGLRAGFEPRPRSDDSIPVELPALLAQVLLAYTLEFELHSELSLPLSEDVVRILDDGLQVRSIPEAGGISKEATSIALTALVKAGYVAVAGRTASTEEATLTAKGETARRRLPKLHAEIRAAWDERFGHADLAGLTAALEGILEHPNLPEGLRPDPEGWRARKPYLARTEALVADPRATLPHHPFVLHRGGWPDGS